MVLRMKNFNVLGVHWKIGLLEGGLWKTNIEEEFRKKEGELRQFAYLMEGLARKTEGGW